MKKLITLFSLVLLITVAKAQQPASTTDQGTTPTATSTSISNDKQVQGVTKDCATPCTDKEMKKCKGKSKDCCAGHDAKTSASTTGSSETMTAEQVNNGAATSTKNDKKKQGCSEMSGKSCCHGATKASAINTTEETQPANSTKQADGPK